MNYYNPYFSMAPYASAVGGAATRGGLFRGLLSGARGINWGSILNNTQRTLGIINQAIPVVKQVSPVMKNARTMFQVMNEFKKVDTPTTSSNQTTTRPSTSSIEKKSETSSNIVSEENQPTFFL